MTVSHRTTAEVPVASAQVPQPLKVARVACCCKLADLLPVVQQMHQEAARNNGRFRQPKAA
ncbi:hypothetical protein [Hymenobacter rubripertinctus]|uniref:Uncharacterized protein n=1 Tax=Hymenobacter rubripertinctus TaxID=2029981 RepID=A0A418QKI6_9BACT|nr:hypothetical protein [Hymenobacter rubripertinctus]RIY05737.1 hypothetical protein D0T11_19945 [Hymenobacter rubripertinctus]